MSRFTLFLVLLSGILAMPVAAEAKPCRIWNGDGTRATFWQDASRRTVEMSRRGHVAVSHACGRPSVRIASEYSGKLRAYVQLVRDDAAGLERPVYVYRVHFMWLGRRMSDSVTVPVRIRTRRKVFPLRVNLVADGLEASIRATEARKEAEAARDEARNAHDEAEKAKNMASSGEKGVAIDFGGFRSLETAGKPGWGAMLSVSGVFSRFGGMWALAAAGKLSWQMYELELIGDNLVNSDVNGQEYDLIGLLQLHLQPAWWFRAHLETGFGLRVFSHPDAVTVQDSNLYIRGTEGRADTYGLWALGLGVRFKPHKRLAFQLFYQLDVTLNKQVNHPSGDPAREPTEANVVNHKLGFGLSIEL
jgi:hypothetical protein